MTDPERRDGRLHPPLWPSVLRVLWQHLRQRHTGRARILLAQLPQVAAHKPSDERGRHVVWVSLDHQREVEDSTKGQVELPKLGPEDDTCDDRCS